MKGREKGTKTTGGATDVAAFVHRFDDHVVGFVHPDDKVSAVVVEDAATKWPVPEEYKIICLLCNIQMYVNYSNYAHV